MKPIVKELLIELRESFNSRYCLRVKQGAKFNAEDWLAHVEQRIIPIVEATLAALPERGRSVFSELYDVSLELFSVGHFCKEQNFQPLQQLWTQVLPKLGALIAREPRRVVGSLSNAVLSIAQTASSDLATWLNLMAQIAPLASNCDQLLELGKVAAWRSGLPQYRTAALKLAEGLPEPILRLLFNASDAVTIESLREWLQSLHRNPWLPCGQLLSAKGCVAEVARYGSFRGFGGVFKAPPQVFSLRQQLYVTDGQSVWQILADQYGCSFQRSELTCDARRNGESSRNPYMNSAGTISWQKQELARSDLKSSVSQAFDGITLAVTIETSFHLFLFSAVPVAT